MAPKLDKATISLFEEPMPKVLHPDDKKPAPVATPDAREVECCCYQGCNGPDEIPHQHEDDPCPVHPDAPFDGTPPFSPSSEPDPRDAELAALRGRVAALTKERDDALAQSERFSRYVDAVAPIAPGTPADLEAALDARIATEREAWVADVKARIEAFPSYDDNRNELLHDVLSAIDAAGRRA